MDKRSRDKEGDAFKDVNRSKSESSHKYWEGFPLIEDAPLNPNAEDEDKTWKNPRIQEIQDSERGYSKLHD